MKCILSLQRVPEPLCWSRRLCVLASESGLSQPAWMIGLGYLVARQLSAKNSCTLQNCRLIQHSRRSARFSALLSLCPVRLKMLWYLMSSRLACNRQLMPQSVVTPFQCMKKFILAQYIIGDMALPILSRARTPLILMILNVVSKQFLSRHSSNREWKCFAGFAVLGTAVLCWTCHANKAWI